MRRLDVFRRRQPQRVVAKVRGSLRCTAPPCCLRGMSERRRYVGIGLVGGKGEMEGTFFRVGDEPGE